MTATALAPSARLVEFQRWLSSCGVGGHARGTQAPTRPAPRLRPSAAVYRRRRLAAAILLACAVALTTLLLGAFPAGQPAPRVLGGGSLTASEAVLHPSTELQPIATRVHVVEPGDTLWSIARRVQPEGDLRPIVDQLAAARGGRALQVGERIVLPAVDGSR